MHSSPTLHSTRASLPQRPRIAVVGALLALTAILAVPAGASAAGGMDGRAGGAPATTAPAAVTALAPAEVEEVLAGVQLTDLSTTQLSELLSQLPGLSTLPEPLRGALTSTIEGLITKGETLGQLTSLPELKALGSLDPSQVLGGLLGSTTEPEQLIGQLLMSSSPQELEALLGTTLTGEPFVKSTVGALAGEVGATPEALAGDLDMTSSQLPASAMALTAPLTDGKTLGVLDAVEGLDMGLLSTREATPEGSGGGSGGSGGSGGGSGGTGGSGGGSGGVGGSGGSGGGSGGPAGTSVVVNNLPAQEVSALSAGARTPARIEILRRKVKGDAITLVVEVSAAGRVSVAGGDVKTASKQAEKAERVTLRTVLTKAGVASLRKHGHRLKLELRASFEDVAGAGASATTTVSVG
ncbi:MAG TPA: hypothetical protein VK778_05210 [Solirubrobacteraceae bacterium]|nr:hypothetical protein [Solirubrobacteraceae bacterium]